MNADELDEIERRAKERMRMFALIYPTVQIPPTEGTDTLRLLEEVKTLRAKYDYTADCTSR
jgi:hypothetical protein